LELLKTINSVSNPYNYFETIYTKFEHIIEFNELNAHNDTILGNSSEESIRDLSIFQSFHRGSKFRANQFNSLKLGEVVVPTTQDQTLCCILGIGIFEEFLLNLFVKLRLGGGLDAVRGIFRFIYFSMINSRLLKKYTVTVNNTPLILNENPSKVINNSAENGKGIKK
jgi:hypothetical protein